MSVDLSKLKAGDTVKFRCGGEAVVESVGTSERIDGVFVRFEDSPEFFGCHYMDRGTLYPSEADLMAGYENNKTLFDIIEIIPKPFDWSEVKPGDQFYYTNSTALGLLSFVALHPTRKGIAICINEAATDKHPRNVSLDDMEAVND